jgi:hypothetical protein
MHKKLDHSMVNGFNIKMMAKIKAIEIIFKSHAKFSVGPFEVVEVE